MSGGHFNYRQSALLYIRDELEMYLLKVKNGGRDLSPDLVPIFEHVAADLAMLYEMVHAIDYYICGDYGEESLTKRFMEIIENDMRERKK